MTGQYPIHLAAASGHTEMVQLLLDNNASLTDEDREGNTPLHLAAKYGQRAIIEMLRGKVAFNIVSVKVSL